MDIQSRVDTQDAESGGITTEWKTVFADVRAAIEPVSTREFLSASKEQSDVNTKIIVRFRPGLNATQRILHGVKCCAASVGREIYNPAGFLRDKESGLEYVTIPCSLGVNEG